MRLSMRKNYVDRGGCYPTWPSASVDNFLRDLQNSSHHMKTEFNKCFIVHWKYFYWFFKSFPLTFFWTFSARFQDITDIFPCKYSSNQITAIKQYVLRILADFLHSVLVHSWMKSQVGVPGNEVDWWVYCNLVMKN